MKSANETQQQLVGVKASYLNVQKQHQRVQQENTLQALEYHYEQLQDL